MDATYHSWLGVAGQMPFEKIMSRKAGAPCSATQVVRTT